MRARLISFLVAVTVFVMDRLTKTYIIAALGPYDSWTLIPGLFNIIHSENPGMAFSLMVRSRFLLVGVSSVVIVLLAVMLWRVGAEQIPLALVLGGAAGNLWDRVLRGSVTDFLDVYMGEMHWPTFNIADSAITIGAFLLVLNMWRTRTAPSTN